MRARAATLRWGFLARWAAAICSASGSPPHSAATSKAASLWVLRRVSPGRRACRALRISATASCEGRVSRSTRRASRWASRSRLVTIARHPACPGSNGSACSVVETLSMNTSTGRPEFAYPSSTDRYSLNRSCASAGTCSPGTAIARKNPATAASASRHRSGS